MLRDSPVLHAWAPEVLLALKDGPRRFNALLNGIEGISDRVLTIRLQKLVDVGLVDRQVVVVSPIRVLYGLTPTGRSYIEPLAQLDAIASKQPELQEVSATA